MTAKSLEKLLNPSNDGELGEIVQRAREIGELVETLSRALPDDLGEGLVAANIRDDDERRLVLIAASSAWASRLRFESQIVLDTAREHGLNVDSVSVRVARVDYNNDG